MQISDTEHHQFENRDWHPPPRVRVQDLQFVPETLKQSPLTAVDEGRNERHVRFEEPTSHRSVHDPLLVSILNKIVDAQARPSGHARDLPTFSGLAEEWPVFIAEFRQSTETYYVSNMENRNRIQRALKGKALEAVRALLIHHDNVEQVIQHLETRFGRPTHIIHSLTKEVGQLKKMKDEEPERLLEFSSCVYNLVAVVKSLGRTGHLQNP
jgi:hypothetical protein